MSSPPFPPSGRYIESVRESSRSIREKCNIEIRPESIKTFLFSPSFTSTFQKLKHAHGMTLPLKFPSLLSELNVLSTLSILNFASGYRVPLHTATGRGAFDTIRALVFSMYISSDPDDGPGNLLSARGMMGMEEGRVAELMRVEGKIHLERPHGEIHGVTVGELGGPVWELVKLVTGALKGTGEVLVKGGYPNLGAFVLEALKEGEKAKLDEKNKEMVDVECDVVVERLVRALPAFQDMAMVDGQPVYCFKKAMLTLHSIALRFGSSSSSNSTSTSPEGITSTNTIPIPRTNNLPIFSDNVIPSLLVHLGVIDLSTSTPSLGLTTLFPNANNPETLQALLGSAPLSSPSQEDKKKPKAVPEAGPTLTTEQAFILRAAAIDACELIVQTAKNLTDEELSALSPASVESSTDLKWLKEITLPEVDAWIWAVAKDRTDYRRLPRFALLNTTFF